jgi:hypothetical protein
MQITIDYEQALFIRDRAAARIKTAMAVLREPYRRQFLAHMPDKHYEEVAAERRAEIKKLRELILEVTQYCDYDLDGRDADGTKWYRCAVHEELAPSSDAPCAGYIEEPYELKLSERI